MELARSAYGFGLILKRLFGRDGHCGLVDFTPFKVVRSGSLAPVPGLYRASIQVRQANRTSVFAWKLRRSMRSQFRTGEGAFGHRVAVGIANHSHGGFDAQFLAPSAEGNTCILRSLIAYGESCRRACVAIVPC